jgi:hypothetical protein
MTNPTAADVIRVAKAEAGYHEGYANGHWNNIEKYAPQVPGLEWAQGQAWCATFVSWCAMKAGAADLFPRTASCDVAGAFYRNAGRWSDYPAIGAQVFYGSISDLNHTGIVYAYDDTYVYTIEGNTNDNGSREGDGVYLKKRARRDSNLVGYGYPKYADGLVSADPDFQEHKPESVIETRGKNVDAALKDLRHSRPSTKNKSKVRAAIDALKSITPWKKK